MLKIRNVINFFYNIRSKYFDKETSAYDNLMSDPRDIQYEELLGGEKKELPERYVDQVVDFPNQNISGYTYSCTGQGTSGATNNGNRIWVNKRTNTSGFDLFDEMVARGLASRTTGAYLSDAVKVGHKLGYYESYGKINTTDELIKSIYNGHYPMVGTSSITWGECKDGLVKNIGSGYGHAFYALGWDNNKVIGDYTGGVYFRNSYGPDHQENGCFWIPFSLLESGILFNSKYAIVPFKNKLLH